MKRKFLFFYLNTGAGHVSAAKVLSNVIKKSHDDVEIEIINGFDKYNFFGHLTFEKGYNYACNYFHGAFPLVYDVAQHRVGQRVFLLPLKLHTTRYLRKLIEEKEPTDIVSFHFALTPFIKSALKSFEQKINFSTIVTDPFTAHNAWFYEKDQNFLVYSDQVKEQAVKTCGVPEKNVTVVPFLINEKYLLPLPSKSDIRKMKKKYGFDEDKKIVLLVGGGEGLPGAVKIINECVLHHAQFAVAVVCGRDKVFKDALDLFKITYPKLDLHVFGFVNYLDELLKICDCAVIKAGPATLMEAICCRKPTIIIKYIHNQELGNMRFAVDNKVGWYIRKPSAVFRKINEFLNDDNLDKKIQTNFEKLHINTNSQIVADILLNK